MSEPGTDLILPNGVLINLDDPASVAMAYDDMQQLKSMVAEVERTLKRSLLEHAGHIGKKTFQIDGVGKVQIKGGSEKHYDAHGLKRDLLAAGCPPERVHEIVRETVELKVMAAEANQAAKANPEYAAIIEQNMTVEDKTPSVTVARVGGSRAPVRGRPGAVERKTAETAPEPADDEEAPW